MMEHYSTRLMNDERKTNEKTRITNVLIQSNKTEPSDNGRSRKQARNRTTNNNNNRQCSYNLDWMDVEAGFAAVSNAKANEPTAPAVVPLPSALKRDGTI
jgi:hypothetical protein